tara:strand:+ start:1518 stop:1715 length:198 start_codon:yes stop_codon:yes gene_type:complete
MVWLVLMSQRRVNELEAHLARVRYMIKTNREQQVKLQVEQHDLTTFEVLLRQRLMKVEQEWRNEE